VPTLGLHVATTQEFWRFPDELADELQRLLPEGWELARADEPAALPALLRRATVLWGWPFPAALARRAKQLRWVHFFTSGVPEGWGAANVEVTSASGQNADSVAEHGLFLALCALRGVRRDSLRAGWDPKAFDVARSPARLGATVVGYGAIGRRLARLLVPIFGTVRAVARSRREAEPGVELYPAERLDEALEGAGLVALALPLTSETRALLAPERLFSRLRPDVCLVNLSRGELLDEAALLAFLERHPDSRYLSDVAHPEPYGDELPLWRSPQVLLTPHIAGRREDMWELIWAQAKRLAAERLRGLS
jgi:phosphoglycerate dehydrogenase-like enzyme